MGCDPWPLHLNSLETVPHYLLLSHSNDYDSDWAAFVIRGFGKWNVVTLPAQPKGWGVIRTPHLCPVNRCGLGVEADSRLIVGRSFESVLEPIPQPWHTAGTLPHIQLMGSWKPSTKLLHTCCGLAHLIMPLLAWICGWVAVLDSINWLETPSPHGS